MSKIHVVGGGDNELLGADDLRNSIKIAKRYIRSASRTVRGPEANQALIATKYVLRAVEILARMHSVAVGEDEL